MKTKAWTANMIIRLRHKLNLSQKEFSEYLGCRQQTVSEWETEIYSPGNAYCRVLSFVERNVPKDKIKLQ